MMLPDLAIPNAFAAAYFAACIVVYGAFAICLFAAVAYLCSGGK